MPTLMVLTQIAQLKYCYLLYGTKNADHRAPLIKIPEMLVSQVIALIDEGSICLESMLVQVPAELVETGLMSLPLHLGPF